MKLPEIADPITRFFAFMQERESIRLAKEAGQPWPWTEDPILQAYKFTNVKREHDKTSRLLIEEFYKPHFDAPREQLLLNCAIARYFGTIEFMRAVGWQETFKPSYLKKIARARMDKGERVYTGAYIVTSGNRKGPKEKTVIDYYLMALWAARGTLCLPYTKWAHFLCALQTVPGFGGSGFMAKEVTLDTRYTSFWGPGTPIDKNTWTPIGPGSARGAARILGAWATDGRKANPADTLACCLELFKVRRQYLPKGFIDLELHDIQFQLCEFDKWERTRLNQGRPRSRYDHPPHQGSLL